jgi:hypothetical protein
MRRIKPAMGGLVVALMLLAPGCGDDGDDGAADAAGEGGPVSEQELLQFLMREGEEPGFRPVGQPATDSGVDAYVKGQHLTPADERRLRSLEFISFTYQPIRGPRTDGVTNVHLFATAEGAEQQMAHSLRSDTIQSFTPTAGVRRFTIEGVPGGRGWTGSKPNVGNAYWVQGRCLLVLGNLGPGPHAGPLSTGARAIYERTNGECP